jgi:uncharacterized membrane protein (TIGR02234 family)
VTVRSPARRLGVTAAALVLAALVLWTSTRLVWVHAGYRSPLRGFVTLTATGGQVKPELVGFALLALAGIAALIASSGWVRRAVGVLLGVEGLWLVWLAASWLFGPPPMSLGEVTPPAGAVAAGAPVRTAAPLLALLAGFVLVAAAVAMVRWARSMPGLGSRYAAPATARRSPDRDSAWWRALDEGEDPTSGGRAGDPGPRT